MNKTITNKSNIKQIEITLALKQEQIYSLTARKVSRKCAKLALIQEQMYSITARKDSRKWKI